MTSSIASLHQLGQSIWYDNIERRLLESGAMASLVAQGEIRGVTSNPSIFRNAIANSLDYDPALIPMAWAGWKAEQRDCQSHQYQRRQRCGTLRYG